MHAPVLGFSPRFLMSLHFTDFEKNLPTQDDNPLRGKEMGKEGGSAAFFSLRLRNY